MSFFAIKVLGLGGAVATTGIGSWYVYSSNSPKTLGELISREGYSLAKEDGAFKAIFVEKKDQIESLKVNQLSSSTDVVSAASKLKAWCNENLALKLDVVSGDVKKQAFDFCVDSYKTLGGFLARKGRDLVENSNKEEDYKTTFALYKNVKEFKEWLNKGKDLGSENYSKLKQKCEEDLLKPLSQFAVTDVNGASWWCVIPKEKTVGELLAKDNVSIMSESSGDAELWSEQFDGWKYSTEIMTAINKDHSEGENVSKDTEGSKGGPKMKKWCEDSKDKKLGDDVVYPSLYTQIKSVCTSKVKDKVRK